MTIQETYIGKVSRFTITEEEYHYCRVDPKLKWSADQAEWICTPESLTEEFPNRGTVFWHNAPLEAKEGSTWQFEVTEHPKYTPNSSRDRFQVSNPREVVEIIDVRHIGSKQEIRRRLTGEGVSLRNAPLKTSSHSCLLWVEDDLWVGPLTLEHLDMSPSYRLATEEDLSRIRRWKLPSGGYAQVELDGTRYLLAPAQNYGLHVGLLNWEAAEVLARRALKHLRKRDREASEKLEITKKVFDAYIDALTKLSLLDSDLENELAFADRIEEIRSVLSGNEDLINEAALLFLETEAFQIEFQKKKEEAHEAMLSEQRRLVERELKEQGDVLRSLREDLSNKAQELQHLNEEIKRKEAELRDREESFERELITRLRNLANQPEKLFAEAAIVRAALMPEQISDVQRRRRQESNRLSKVRELALPELEDHEDILGAVGIRLMEAGISPFIGRFLHTAFLAGFVPVVFGTAAQEILSIYATVATADRFHWIPIGGTVYEPSDLLARFDPSSRILIPHPGGLLDVLVQAKESQDMHLVILEGFNRAPVESYLLPLLYSLEDVYIGQNPRKIPLVSSGLLAPDDPYVRAESVSWQPNVLLALVPVLGGSTLPTTDLVWRYAVPIDSDAEPPLGIDLNPYTTSGSETAGKLVTQISAKKWQEWKQEARLVWLKKIPDILRDSIGSPQLARTDRQKVLRLHAVATLSGFSDEKAKEFALKMGLLPSLAATETRDTSSLAELGLSEDEQTRKILEAMRSLKE